MRYFTIICQLCHLVIISSFDKVTIAQYKFDYNDTTNDEWDPPIYPVDDPYCASASCLVTEQSEFVYRRISIVMYHSIGVSIAVKVKQDGVYCLIDHAKDSVTAHSLPLELELLDRPLSPHRSHWQSVNLVQYLAYDNTSFTLRLGTVSDKNTSQCFWDNLVVYGVPYFTASPTNEPTAAPTEHTLFPTLLPSASPIVSPTSFPTQTRTLHPTLAPTVAPSSDTTLFLTVKSGDRPDAAISNGVKAALAIIIILFVICVLWIGSMNAQLLCSYCQNNAASLQAPGAEKESADTLQLQSRSRQTITWGAVRRMVSNPPYQEEHEEARMLQHGKGIGEESVPINTWELLEIISNKGDEGVEHNADPVTVVET